MPKTMSLLLDRLQVASLVDALRHHLALAGRSRGTLGEVFREGDVLVLGDELRGGLDVPFGQLVALVHHRGELAEHALGPDDVAGFALDDHLVADSYGSGH